LPTPPFWFAIATIIRGPEAGTSRIVTGLADV